MKSPPNSNVTLCARPMPNYVDDFSHGSESPLEMVVEPLLEPSLLEDDDSVDDHFELEGAPVTETDQYWVARNPVTSPVVRRGDSVGLKVTKKRGRPRKDAQVTAFKAGFFVGHINKYSATRRALIGLFRFTNNHEQAGSRQENIR